MVEAVTARTFRIAAISGSLRKASTNTALLRLASELAPAGRTEFVFVDYLDVPIYNGDVEAVGIPESVKRVAEIIKNADAVYIASPEYNYTIAAPLKNIIDWLSRVEGKIFNEKPVAILSCAASNGGGVRAQYDLRRAFTYLNSLVLQQPEVAVGANYLKFNAEGKLTDDGSIAAVKNQVTAFVSWIEFSQKGRAVSQ